MEKKDIEHLATLARIELEDTEAEALSAEISAILNYVGQVNEITADRTREKTVGAVHSVMREDGEPHEAGVHTEELLAEAPTRKGQYIQVKKILGDE